MHTQNTIGRPSKMEIIVPKPLDSTRICCSWLGRTGASRAASYHQRTAGLQKWGGIMRTATSLLSGYLLLKLLVPLGLVSSHSKWGMRVISLISARSSDLSSTTEDGKTIFFPTTWKQHVFLHLHMSSDKENITTLLAPKLKLHWAHYQRTQSLLCWYAQMSRLTWI